MTPEEIEIRKRFPDYPDWLVTHTVKMRKDRQATWDRSERIAQQGMTTRPLPLDGSFRRDDVEKPR